MYRLTEIVNDFSKLVGWEGVEALERTDSGLYFQEAHPLLTLRAMESIKPKDETIEGYLGRLTRGGIKKVVSKFITEKIANVESRNIIDKRCLFDGSGRKEARTHSSGKLVGFEITPLRGNGITTTLNKVGLQFIGNTGVIKLYLFHSSKSEPIATKECNFTNSNGSFMWFDLDWCIPYMTEETNGGGSWYVVYDQNALPDYMDSINFGRDWSREPCGTCNKGDVQLYRMMTKYATFSPFYVAVDDWDGMLWDIEGNIYCNGNNYGLNFMFTMSCDVTDMVISERSLFAHAIQLQVATDALRALALNPEVNVNRVQFNAEKDDIMFALEGNGQGIKGLTSELSSAYKALEVDTKGLDPICLACHNKGVRFRSI